MSTVIERLTWIEEPSRLADVFADDICAGLTARPKRIPCRHFYDAEGSRLFEAITALPEYYPTRTERGILLESMDELVSALELPVTLVELGSGSAAKTRLFIEALLSCQGSLSYLPIDVSAAMLEQSSLALLQDYADLQVTAVAADYERGWAKVRESVQGPRLLLWLGSSIGNLDPRQGAEFLARIARSMTARDRLVLGMDLHKSRTVLEPAYNDSRGVTAAFNLNLLARINRELGGRFDLCRFAHRAVYNTPRRRIEMYLVSLASQRVRIEDLDLEICFEAGEMIHTENSHKYTRADILSMLRQSGLSLKHQYFDGQRHFSLNLAGLRPVP